MKNPMDMSGYTIDPPCVFVNQSTMDTLPLGLARAIDASPLTERMFMIVRIDGIQLNDSKGDVFFIDDDYTGESYIARGVGGFDEWLSIFTNKKAAALKVFVDRCGSGMFHTSCWEDIKDSTRLTEEEFNTLYCGSIDESLAALATIITEK